MVPVLICRPEPCGSHGAPPPHVSGLQRNPWSVHFPGAKRKRERSRRKTWVMNMGGLWNILD
jgi:hypothetical protein